MPLSLTLGGIDRTAQSVFQSLLINNTLVTNADTAEFDIVLAYGSTWRPQAGNQVVIVNGNTTEFGGVITQVEEAPFRGVHFQYKCLCRDYTWLFDRTLVVTTYTQQAASAIVSDIVANYTSGFTSNNVKSAPTIGAQFFDYVPPSEAVRFLADLLGWGWYIDYAKDVHFYDLNASTAAAPVASINLDTSVNSDYGGMNLSETISHEKNDIFVKGFKQALGGNASFNFRGDGTTRFFEIGYQPASSSGISITRAPAGSTAITQTINIDSKDGSPNNPTGGANTAFVCFDNMGVRWDTAPGSSDAIVVTTPYLQDIPIEEQDTVAQSTMATREGGSGVHQFVIDDPSLTSPDGTDTLARTKALHVLNRYAWPKLQGKFISYTQGWRAGQSFTLTTSRRMGGFTKTMYVHSVAKKLVNHPSGGTPLLRYEMEIADSVQPV